MKILVIGSGGREHAIVWKLAQSSRISKIYCAPGNGGTGLLAENVMVADSDLPGLLRLAQERAVDLVVVGPEVPLVMGIVDLFEESGIPIFGPNKQAARLEGSKEFGKQIMYKYNIPTATYAAFTKMAPAWDYVQENQLPLVIKADGLAAGKGVTIAVDLATAHEALKSIFEDKRFGQAGAKVVIEEFLSGEEVSLLAFTDGRTILPMASAQDHKAVYEGDKGPNTGGMGAYSPAPVLDNAQTEIVVQKILKPLLKGLASEGIEYRGVIYVGLMMTALGPQVVEFNVRFGDPETQVILPRLQNDLLTVMLAVVEGQLHQVTLSWASDSCLSVVLASGGYPGNYAKDKAISGLNSIENCLLFHAGTRMEKERLLTAGGRVLNVTALGNTLQQAQDQVYTAIEKINFEGRYYRRDIGYRALNLSVSADVKHISADGTNA